MLNIFYTPALDIPSAEDVFRADSLRQALDNNSEMTEDKRNMLDIYLNESASERQKIANENDLRELIEIFYVLLIQSEHPAVIENTTLLLDQFITADPNRVPLFDEISPKLTVMLCQRLIRQMRNADLTILKASISLFTILTATTSQFEEFRDVMVDYFQLIRSVYTPETPSKTAFIPLHLYNWSLFVLLNKKLYRTLFSKEIPLNFLNEVHEKIYATQDQELLYGLFHVVWLLSFDQKMVENEFPEQFISIFANVLLKMKVEKIIRIVLLIIHNLLSVDWYVRLLVQHDFNRIIPVLLTRTFDDKDIIDLLDEINETVEKKLTETTSIQCYLDEMKSGRMRWSPMHRSEQFWTENITVFENDNWALVRKLKGIINDKSADQTCVSVACFDLGEVARYHPLGRKVMNDLGIKNDLLELSNTSNNMPEVNKNAIYALQKIMLHRWDLIQNE